MRDKIRLDKIRPNSIIPDYIKSNKTFILYNVWYDII